jgi:hypothetical protein
MTRKDTIAPMLLAALMALVISCSSLATTPPPEGMQIDNFGYSL